MTENLGFEADGIKGVGVGLVFGQPLQQRHDDGVQVRAEVGEHELGGELVFVGEVGATAKGDAAFFHEGEQPFGVFRQGGYRVNQVSA